MSELEIEKKKLKETLVIIKEILKKEKDSLQNVYDTFIGSIEDLWKITTEKEIHIKNIEASEEKPYFARIDFQYDGSDTVNTIYIGKNGISKNSDIIVVDWRAPISSLYYDSEIGKCEFKAPEGLVTGNMSLKRQFDIEKGELLDYYDVDLVSNDELLQKYLNANNDARIKSIVSTIQKEQNDVIRREIKDNLIIQGVAGSGKTTVALHRIAYLVYNYMKFINQNQYLVIGPNPVFIKYIKSVLPDLDVSSVRQCTFEQFSKDYLNEDIQINSSEKKAMYSIAGKLKNDVAKFKCSMKYKMMLDEFMKKYIDDLTSSNLNFEEFVIIPKEIIREEFNKFGSSPNLETRIDITTNRLCRYVESNIDNILSQYNSYSFNLFKAAKTDIEKEKLRERFSKEIDTIKKGCKSVIRKYFLPAKISPTKLYKKFIININNYDIFNYEYLTQLKKETLTCLKQGTYDFEDLAALLYIKSNMFDCMEFSKIRHVVIDEAQDLGEFNFYVLKGIFPIATYSIFGDLAQSIYDYRGIDDWNKLNSIMFDNKGNIIKFGKSYRTTAEIMSVADKISSSIGLGESDMVVRHGNDVEFTKLDTSEEIPAYIKSKILEYKMLGYRTIAVISKTNLMSCYMNDDLKDLDVNIPNVTFNDDVSDEKFEICTISNQLAKGLEFDAVIINDVSEKIYSSNSTLDMKLLYVALTRALHQLDIIYTGEITYPLKEYCKNNKTK